MNLFNWSDTFGFRQNPFKDTLDTDLFFRTRQHEEALIKLMLGIADGHALILLTGVSGTGKTFVSQVALRDLEANRFAPAFVSVYPGMGKGPLLKALLAELDSATPGRTTQDLLRQLQNQAMALHEQGRRLVVVIDEAHFLKADALHLLRTLSNLETEKEKLITVLLVAEPGLKRRLNNPSYASLRGRITFAAELGPLSENDTEQYVKYRLLKSGAYPELLPAGLYPEIHRLSGGIPREINRLLYQSFIEAMTAEAFTVTPQLLCSVAREEGRLSG